MAIRFCLNVHMVMDIILAACVQQAAEDVVFAVVWSRYNSQISRTRFVVLEGVCVRQANAPAPGSRTKPKAQSLNWRSLIKSDVELSKSHEIVLGRERVGERLDIEGWGHWSRGYVSQRTDWFVVLIVSLRLSLDCSRCSSYCRQLPGN